jgi:hypothetical protein
MKTIGNIIWFVFAGIWLALGYAAAGLVACITIIGIPFGITVDFDSVADDSVTLRERDSMAQVSQPIYRHSAAASDPIDPSLFSSVALCRQHIGGATVWV